MTIASKPRILLAVTFYNGRDFARRTLESIAGIDRDGFDLDVLVLDDCSPEPGFSAVLAAIAQETGAVYYRSPRNQGIPRNVNLGLVTALKLDYDFVVISNSDVIYARNSVRVLLDVIASSPEAASATAWSTNVDPYSIPNGTELLSESQAVVDVVGGALFETFGVSSVEIPAGISFAMIIPVGVLRTVGLMDPIFGRGYGEESDWSARASDAGFRHLLAVGAFVYHAGRGSTLAAGVVTKDQIADWGNQKIVDHRSPQFAPRVLSFLQSGVMDDVWPEALRSIVKGAAAAHGYAVVDATRDWQDPDSSVVLVALSSHEYAAYTAHWQGFTTDIEVDGFDVMGSISGFFANANPIYTNVRDAKVAGTPAFGYPLEV